MRKMAATLSILVLAATAAFGQFVQKPDKDGVYAAGIGIAPAKLVHGAEAAYPTDPGLAGIRHVCALRAVIGADGAPGAIQVINQESSPFDDAAVAAVKLSKFEPSSYQGNPVPIYQSLWVPFNLGNGVAPVVVTRGLKELSSPVALNTIMAEFPKQARKEKVQGIVLVQVLVTEAGLPTNATVLWPAGHGFDENALKAIGKYRFKPATLYGVPVPMDIPVEVNFRLY